MRNGGSTHRPKPREADDGYEDKIERVTESGCWLWTGSTCRRYGRITRNNRQVLAHRFMFERAFGPIPAKMCACHRCDVPECVNPGHIFIGDHLANMADAGAKGILSRRRPSNFKLFAHQVLAIRESTEGTMVLARRYGVEKGTIADIRKGRTWVSAPLVK